MDIEESTNLGFYVRTPNRRYRCAEPELILNAARQIVASRMQRGQLFGSPTAAGSFFEERLAGYDREVFAVALLDARHRLMDYTELFQGTLDGAEVHPREVARLRCAGMRRPQSSRITTRQVIRSLPQRIGQ